MKLLGADGGHEWPPLIYGCPPNPEGARDGGMVSIEVLEDVGCSHKPIGYTTVDLLVNQSRQPKIYSGKRTSTLRYLAMGNARHRVRPSKRFNGEVIKQLREEKRHGMSQDGLAQLVGTTKANVSKWERARQQVDISYELFLALAAALYTPPEELARLLSMPPAPGAPTSNAVGRPSKR